MAARNRFRPLVAYRAMRTLRENPDDTAGAIVVIAALSGNSGKRLFNRCRRSLNAERILREEVCNRSDDGEAPMELSERTRTIIRTHGWLAS